MAGPNVLIARAVDERDLADWVGVRAQVNRRWPLSLDELRFFSALEPGRVNLLAREGPAPVGVAFAGPLHETPDSDHGQLWIGVPEARRGAGVGGQLLARCATHLRSLGKVGAETWVDADQADALAFVAHRGYREAAREQTVVLDLEAWQPSGRPLPAGVEIVDLATRPDLLRAVWEIDCEVTPDIPAAEPEQGIEWEAFARLVDKPGQDLRLAVVALLDAEPVGHAWLSRSQARPELALHWMTGVRRAVRGRGIAGALKEEQLRRAKACGVRYARTNNELRNTPIRRLNERLGYEPEPERITLRGPLA